MASVHSTTDGPQAGPSGIPLPTTAFSRVADRVINFIGEASSWIWTVLMLLIVFQVAQRYIFGLGSIMFEEIQWHLYAVGFLLGLAMTEVRERHVRIDVLAEHWPLRLRLRVELLGIIGLLLTFALFLLWFAVPFVVTSWQLNEASSAPGGLPYRYALKSFIVTAFALLALAGFSRLSRVWAALRARD
ncbi:MAG: TRAP transporter small permease subunit [Hyphomicrobiaceae bacterium]|nr:MAG: TRAP transporter small permease subunit [Hyphomicrobiaceae bacterium]